MRSSYSPDHFYFLIIMIKIIDNDLRPVGTYASGKCFSSVGSPCSCCP